MDSYNKNIIKLFSKLYIQEDDISVKEMRELIYVFLIKNNKKLPAEILDLSDKILQFELSQKKITDVDGLPISKFVNGHCIKLIKSDITLLKADAIVNAANNAGYGCFMPNHKCIDNIIHANAGPRLREKCEPIEDGKVHITSGFNLPAKYILHTVGPVYDEDNISHCKEVLVNCYKNCLHVSKSYNIQSVVFCCISTGVFGYPKEDACKIAISTVEKFLMTENTHKFDVVFCVYNDDDLNTYLKFLGK